MPDYQPALTGRALKVTVMLDPAEVIALPTPLEQRVTLRVKVPGRFVSANIAAKSLRKAATTIREHGTEACIALIQGKLGPGDVMEECGLIAQIKAAPKVAA